MGYVVLVTGASSGLGKSIAFHLHNLGHTVYGTSRDPKKYTEDFPFSLLPLDVTDEASIEALLIELEKKETKIDVLINNAGVGITGPVEETSLDAIRANFETNFFGPLAMIQRVLPLMRKNNNGIIINITSIAGYMGLPFRGAYSASKGALNIISEALRLEIAAQGIRLMTLAPGDYATDIASRRFHAPVIEGSPYQKAYQESLDTMDSHVDGGNDPIEIAHRVAELIHLKKPRPHYLVGPLLQKFSLTLKKILPQKAYEKLLKNHYKL
ncbi:SDR family oxidoreductase [Flavobacteriaceae bacterium]|nr:SDR family oxidoreductase [Flavobacteriaceae bacterium]MDB4715477.1 SDR family oxidoreductase [Flavobacteriaceae bacterium]